MAAKVDFFSRVFVEASPETLGFLWNAKNGRPGVFLVVFWWKLPLSMKQRRFLRLAAKVVFLSGGLVEAIHETAKVLKVSS